MVFNGTNGIIVLISEIKRAWDCASVYLLWYGVADAQKHSDNDTHQVSGVIAEFQIDNYEVVDDCVQISNKIVYVLYW